jgi:hypothetical protein
MLQRGRSLFLVLAIGLIGVLLVTVRRLPPVVASHFDGAGVPNGWSSRQGYAIVLIGTGVLLPLAITGLVISLTRKGPARLNIPARDYWSRPEHSHEAVLRVRAYMWWLGCLMAGLTLSIHWLVMAAHAHEPPRLRTSAVLTVLGAVFLGIVVWAAGWYRLLRPPRSG